ncbi:MAG: DUF3788 family protein [Ignavibacteriales bacterium]|nr:DUF3788 family protein [Ignavibacteriales bacterium]
MDQPALSDKTQFPTEEIIFSHLGKTKDIWITFFEYLQMDHPDIIPEWRYYNDGKSWLMKNMLKKKNLFWLSIREGTFRTTFYFTDRAAKAIVDSAIPAEMKKEFKDGKHYGKIRGLTVVFKFKKDIETAKALLEIKLSVK